MRNQSYCIWVGLLFYGLFFFFGDSGGAFVCLIIYFAESHFSFGFPLEITTLTSKATRCSEGTGCRQGVEEHDPLRDVHATSKHFCS